MPSFSRSFRRDLSGAVALAVLLGLGASTSARAQTTPFQPSAAQPVLPPGGGSKPTSPVVESLMDQKPPVLEVRKAHRHQARRETHLRHHHVARYRMPVQPLERPALAGVELLQPLPRPGQPPHIAVPVPGYPLDSFITAYTTPLPPIVCHPTRRDSDLPDPPLYRERAVICEADNP